MGSPGLQAAGSCGKGPAGTRQAAGGRELICRRRASKQGASPSCSRCCSQRSCPPPSPLGPPRPPRPRLSGRLRPLQDSALSVASLVAWKGPRPALSSAHTSSFLLPQAVPFRLCPTMWVWDLGRLHSRRNGNSPGKALTQAQPSLRPLSTPRSLGRRPRGRRQGHASGRVGSQPASGVVPEEVSRARGCDSSLSRTLTFASPRPRPTPQPPPLCFPPLLPLVFPSLLFANSAKAALVACLDVGSPGILGDPELLPTPPDLRGSPELHCTGHTKGQSSCQQRVCWAGGRLPGGGRP